MTPEKAKAAWQRACAKWVAAIDAGDRRAAARYQKRKDELLPLFSRYAVKPKGPRD